LCTGIVQEAQLDKEYRDKMANFVKNYKGKIKEKPKEKKPKEKKKDETVDRPHIELPMDTDSK